MLIEFTDDTKLGRTAHTLFNKNEIQNDIKRLTIFIGNDRRKCNIDNCEVMRLGNRSQIFRYRMGFSRFSRSSCKENMEYYFIIN